MIYYIMPKFRTTQKIPLLYGGVLVAAAHARSADGVVERCARTAGVVENKVYGVVE